MRTAYIDMIGGVSGDMLLGALLACGLDLDGLRSELSKLNCGGFDVTAVPARRGGIDATLAGVELDEDGERGRDWAEFERTLEESTLSTDVKSAALKVFDLLARAESAAHGVSKAETHLHELGTVDTLVDIVGVVAGFRLLGIEKIYASPFPLSSGTSRSSHGVMGATAAATAEIYRSTGVPVRAGGRFGPSGEAVTPTGAALVATLASFEPVSMVPEITGYGAGARDPEGHPNVVGLWIGSQTASGDAAVPTESNLRLLETNIDDMTGEAIGYLQERLMEAGALDAWVTPILMKKGRPAVTFSVLCRPEAESQLALRILRESTTLGIRRRSIERYLADRDFITVSVHGTDVAVKVKRLNGEVAGVQPEYEDCRKIARRTGLPLRDVMAAAEQEARQHLGN